MKKANKAAVKRMKLAGKLLADNKKDAFYDEVLKALWGYISDKLSIPVSRLSKDNVEGELRNYGVVDALIKDFLDAITKRVHNLKLPLLYRLLYNSYYPNYNDEESNILSIWSTDRISCLGARNGRYFGFCQRFCVYRFAYGIFCN